MFNEALQKRKALEKAMEEAAREHVEHLQLTRSRSIVTPHTLTRSRSSQNEQVIVESQPQIGHSHTAPPIAFKHAASFSVTDLTPTDLRRDHMSINHGSSRHRATRAPPMGLAQLLDEAD